MPTGTVAKLNVVNQADNSRLGLGMRKAEQMVDRSAKRMGSSLEQNLNFAAGFTKALAALGAIEGAMRGVQVVTALMRGDLDAANEAWRQMPLGIGAVAGAIQDVVNDLHGLNELQKKFDEQLKKAQARARLQNQADRQLSILQRSATLGSIDDLVERKIKAAELDRDATIVRSRNQNLRTDQRRLFVALANQIFQQQVRQAKREGRNTTGGISRANKLLDPIAAGRVSIAESIFRANGRVREQLGLSGADFRRTMERERLQKQEQQIHLQREQVKILRQIKDNTGRVKAVAQ